MRPLVWHKTRPSSWGWKVVLLCAPFLCPPWGGGKRAGSNTPEWFWALGIQKETKGWGMKNFASWWKSFLQSFLGASFSHAPMIGLWRKWMRASSTNIYRHCSRRILGKDFCESKYYKFNDGFQLTFLLCFCFELWNIRMSDYSDRSLSISARL